MRTSLTGFAIFSLFVLMMVPAYASVTVTSMSLEQSFYTTDEDFSFIGTINGTEPVFVIIRDSSGNYEGMLSDSFAIDEFGVAPRPVEDFFDKKGIYDATAFTNTGKEADGFTIEIEFDGKRIFEVSDTILQLDTITDKTVEVGKTITFTASITDSSIEDAVFSISNYSMGATIDPSSGKFIWTPSKAYGGVQDRQYYFEVIVKEGAQEDRETFIITVKQSHVEPEKQPEPRPTIQSKESLEIPAPFVDEAKDPQSYVDRYNNEETYKEWFDDNYSEYESIYDAVGLEAPKELAPFVDETKDPQSYVDRYNNEETYKEWFDDNYSEYDSIYEAVGLETPKELAPFVDETKDPQSYVNRYNNEETYKEWFDKAYPDITIYEAVGLDKPLVKEKKFGICGPGTDLIDGVCTIIEKPKVKPWWQFW